MPHATVGLKDVDRYEDFIENKRDEIRDDIRNYQKSQRASQQDAARGLNWKAENPEAVMSTHLRELIRDQNADMPAVDARFNMSVALLKDGRVPEIFSPQSWGSLEDKNEARILFDQYLNDARNYTACHDVASELVNIFGDDPGQVFSGKGDDRAQGIEAAQNALKLNRPSVMQIKHKDVSGDGHSFVLFNTGNVNNTIQSIEAWAVPSAGGPPPMNQRADLYAWMTRGMRNINVNEAITALGEISSDSPDARNHGLSILSRAGGRPAFEKQQQDYNLLETTIIIKPLAPPNEVQDRFRGRRDTLNQMVNSLLNP